MHPPSTAVFMNTYDTQGFSFDGYYRHSSGDLQNGKWEEDVTTDAVSVWNSEDADILGMDLWYHVPYFSAGFSADWGSIYWNAGFVSKYLGVQLWYAINQKGFGLALIEQYPLLSHIKIGLSEHISRNVYIHSEQECCTFADVNERPYYEIGVGGYVSFFSRFSMEFRYGNELESANNRFYLIAGVLFDP